MKLMYEAWFEPTIKGVRAFGWKAERTAGSYQDREDANYACYEAKSEQAHDFGIYGRYVVREVSAALIAGG